MSTKKKPARKRIKVVNVELQKKPKVTRHKRTIPTELLAQWKKLERKNDSEKLANLLIVSKPTIDKALIYGCVHQQMIVDGINKYFEDRLNSERATADRLKDLQTTPDPVTT